MAVAPARPLSFFSRAGLITPHQQVELHSDLIFMLDRRQTLEMDEAPRQNLVPALPIQPLCQADCTGLCPTCGTNRNTAPCGCETADVYRPFAERLVQTPLAQGAAGQHRQGSEALQQRLLS